MPQEKITVNYRGTPHQATPVPFVAERIQPSTYRLEDGTLISIQAVVVTVVRIDGLWTEDGDPVYQVRSQPVLSISEVRPENRQPL